MHLALEGNIFIYPGDLSAPAAPLLESRLISNSTVSNLGTRLFCADIKDYFMNNPMSHFEYMKIMLQWFLQYIIYQYNITDLVDKDGFVYVNICKSIYRLK